jgi:hypothetical protein
MKPFLVALGCLFGVAGCFGSNTAIDVGGTELVIASPNGFAPVTPEMTRLLDLLDTFVTPVNQRFLWFLDAGELAKAKTGRAPGVTRSFSVQCTKKDVEKFASNSDFAKLKKILREQNAALLKKLEKQMPGYLEKVNKDMQRKFDWKGTIDLNGMVPAPGQEETDRSISYPKYVKYNVTEAGGQQNSGASVVVATVLHLKGRLIFLYCNGDENDLSWARTASKQWASAVIAANPSDAATAARESAASNPGLGLNGVLMLASIAGGIGGVIVLLNRLRKRMSS